MKLKVGLFILENERTEYVGVSYSKSYSDGGVLAVAGEQRLRDRLYTVLAELYAYISVPLVQSFYGLR